MITLMAICKELPFDAPKETMLLPVIIFFACAIILPSAVCLLSALCSKSATARNVLYYFLFWKAGATIFIYA